MIISQLKIGITTKSQTYYGKTTKTEQWTNVGRINKPTGGNKPN